MTKINFISFIFHEIHYLFIHKFDNWLPCYHIDYRLLKVRLSILHRLKSVKLVFWLKTQYNKPYFKGEICIFQCRLSNSYLELFQKFKWMWLGVVLEPRCFSDWSPTPSNLVTASKSGGDSKTTPSPIYWSTISPNNDNWQIIFLH